MRKDGRLTLTDKKIGALHENLLCTSFFQRVQYLVTHFDLDGPFLSQRLYNLKQQVISHVMSATEGRCSLLVQSHAALASNRTHLLCTK
jgi:hypothetical protein